MNRRRVGLAACALYVSGGVVAQSEPVVRAEITPASVNVGESAELRVTVLVPTWFTKPPVYPGLELPNAITRLPADSSNPLRERVGREVWSGIERRYRIYPLLGARYRLSDKAITVTYADPGADPITVDVSLPEVTFRGYVPPGAEALDPYLAGRSLTLTLEVDGATDQLTTGDALVLEYTARLDGLPAIFLPPLAPGLDDTGLSVYAEEPQLSDGPPARRSERLTLVFQAGGSFTVPDRELRYWNTDTQSVEVVTAAGSSVSVEGAPDVDRPEEPGRALPLWQAGCLLTIAAVLVLLLVRASPAMSRRYRAALHRRRRSEAQAFRELTSAVRSGSPQTIYTTLLSWVRRLAPGLELREFAETFGHDGLAQDIGTLSAGLYRAGSEGRPPNRRALQKGLRVARKRCLKQKRAATLRGLPALNP